MAAVEAKAHGKKTLKQLTPNERHYIFFVRDIVIVVDKGVDLATAYFIRNIDGMILVCSCNFM